MSAGCPMLMSNGDDMKVQTYPQDGRNHKPRLVQLAARSLYRFSETAFFTQPHGEQDTFFPQRLNRVNVTEF